MYFRIEASYDYLKKIVKVGVVSLERDRIAES